MSNWTNFLAGVRTSYWTKGTPSLAQQYRALADFAHSIFIRQFESDIPLAKGFLDSYAAAKIALAGSTIPGTLSTVQAAVLALLPIDADTANAQPTLLNAIEQALNDFNGTSARFDVEIANAAMDLQRHVPFYQGRNETTILWNSAGISNQGFVSQIALPQDFRIQAVWSGRYFLPLAENVAYLVDDIVASNGRYYKVLVAGSLNTGELGGGLTSQDPSTPETLGSMQFEYCRHVHLVPVRKMAWGNREALYAGVLRGGPSYTVSPQFDKLWLYPPLLDDRQFFILEWTGVKTSWSGSDLVTFDILAQQAAAQYVRAVLLKDDSEDARNSASAFQMYQVLLRKAVVDNQARETGTTSTTSELLYMNLGRAPWWTWWRRRRCGGSGSGEDSNSQINLVNPSGDTTVYSRSHNHSAIITFSGASSPRRIVLDVGTSQQGDRIIIDAIFPATLGILVQFFNGSTSGTLLSSYATDGVITTGAWEFVFDGTAWVYQRAQIPA